MIEQGSPEWHAQRLGKVTGSKIADMLARTKSGWGASRANYMAQLVSERLTGRPTEGFTSAAMEWGKEVEDQARKAYQFYSGSSVQKCGFIDHPTVTMAGVSPDGLVGDDGGLEMKCPNTATHIETLRGRAIPSRYVLQMQWQMGCTGRHWVDFVSYDPRMPDDMQLFVRRLERDPAKIIEVTAAVVAFLEEVDEAVADLVALYRRGSAAA